MTKGMKPATTLVSTVGTSLFKPNLEAIAKSDPASALARAYRDLDDKAIARGLAEFDPAQRECGAEINSIHSLRKKSFIAPDANLFFCHSATPDGRAIALTAAARGAPPAARASGWKGKGPRRAVVSAAIPAMRRVAACIP